MSCCTVCTLYCRTTPVVSVSKSLKEVKQLTSAEAGRYYWVLDNQDEGKQRILYMSLSIRSRLTIGTHPFTNFISIRVHWETGTGQISHRELFHTLESRAPCSMLAYQH